MGTSPVDIDRIVETTLGATVRSCERVTDGRMAETYRLELTGTPARAVCKVGGPSVRTGDVIEPLVVRLVGETTDLPVPAVLASGTLPDATGARRQFALYEFCEGEDPTEFDALAPADRRRVLRQVGSMLGRLHATHQFERTGGLAREGDDLRIRAPRGLHVPEKGRRLLGAIADSGSLDHQPVLTHGDLFPGNLLVDGGTVTAVLDWGNAHVTAAGYALARAEMRFVDWFRFPARERARLRRALRTGYREHRPLPSDYPRFGPLYKLLWLGQSGERHLRHTTTSRGRQQLRDHLGSVLSSVGPDY
jgi:aminoglycoside phosphotransferase (APT) family kinase protein